MIAWTYKEGLISHKLVPVQKVIYTKLDRNIDEWNDALFGTDVKKRLYAKQHYLAGPLESKDPWNWKFGEHRHNIHWLNHHKWSG